MGRSKSEKVLNSARVEKAKKDQKSKHLSTKAHVQKVEEKVPEAWHTCEEALSGLSYEVDGPSRVGRTTWSMCETQGALGSGVQGAQATTQTTQTTEAFASAPFGRVAPGADALSDDFDEELERGLNFCPRFEGLGNEGCQFERCERSWDPLGLQRDTESASQGLWFSPPNSLEGLGGASAVSTPPGTLQFAAPDSFPLSGHLPAEEWEGDREQLVSTGGWLHKRKQFDDRTTGGTTYVVTGGKLTIKILYPKENLNLYCESDI